MQRLRTLHVFTVGVSLLRNAARDQNSRFLRLARVMGFNERVLKSQGRLEPGLWSTIGELENRENSDTTIRELVEALHTFAHSNPRAASAELNAFLGMTGSLSPNQLPGMGVALIYTMTSEGSLAALVLKRLLEERGHPTWHVGVEGYDSPGEFAEGLFNLVRAFHRLLYDDPGFLRPEYNPGAVGIRVLVNATGGFKPESAFVTLVSFLLPQVHAVYYIHEAFRDVVIIPRFPISVDRHWLCRLLALDGELLHTVRQELGFSDDSEGDVEHLKNLGLISIDEEGRVRVAPWLRELQYIASPHEPCGEEPRVL